MYSRIQADARSVDPFSGLYLGTFGPHGPEVLQLQRSRAEVRRVRACRGGRMQWRMCMTALFERVLHGSSKRRVIFFFRSTGLARLPEASYQGSRPQL